MNAATFDPRPPFLRAVDQLEKLASQVTPEQLGRPTPCTEYDTRALLSHVVGAVHRIAYTGEGGRALDVAPLTGEVADDDWAGAVGRARARAAAAWSDDEKLETTTEMPWGHVPGRIALSGYVMETVTHTWDLAQVIGPSAELDDELAQISLGIARQVLPADERGEDVPFGPVQPAPADASVYTQLAGWLGRKI